MATAAPGQDGTVGSRLAPEESPTALETHPVYFTSSAGCGDASSFLRAFETRSSSLRLVPGPEGSAIQVELAQSEGHTTARLTIRVDDGRVVERSLEAVSCEEALEAIAFVTALALRPEDVRPKASTSPVQHSEPPLLERDLPPSAPPPAPEDSAKQWSLGALVSGTMGPAPGLLWGAEAELAWQGTASSGWAPALRVGAGFWSSATSVQSEGTARFERRQLSLDFCPLGVGGGPLTLRLCLQGAAGAVVAEGTETYRPNRSVRPWAELGGSLWPVVALGSRLSWTTRIAAGVPLYRDTYLFDDRTFYEVPKVVGSLSSGISIRFP